ncbi:hypothetical protein MIZ03_4117 [Rhodoferax lithotrophicus]|uniref:OmpH family outer membrane protein n=1 Tax=Rhodoferax lithotrophicus TaxID=2798804 RepID=A0ABN6DB49_9BURK|nr:OmpH family outer membrane protein [Rhodoferax sp. MIZ03]BCO29205.1 hypothetical protein MIZ03_4117 [Rhodoferax sp. MIZ03]
MNTFFRIRSALFVFLGILVATQLQAQEVHIGFVKTERIFKEATAAKVAQEKLTQEFSKRDKEIIDRGGAFKSEVDKFQIEAPTWPEAERLAREKQMAEQDRAIQLMRRSFQEDLAARKNDELQLLWINANKIIKQMAKTEKYDLIFQDAVYVNPKFDITDKVLKAMNTLDKK